MNLLAISTSSIETISIIVTVLCIISLVVMIIKWKDASDKGYRLGKYDGVKEAEAAAETVPTIVNCKVVNDISKTIKISKSRMNPLN